MKVSEQVNNMWANKLLQLPTIALLLLYVFELYHIFMRATYIAAGVVHMVRIILLRLMLPYSVKFKRGEGMTTAIHIWGTPALK